jgi:hypothetical protein
MKFVNSLSQIQMGHRVAATQDHTKLTIVGSKSRAYVDGVWLNGVGENA